MTEWAQEHDPDLLPPADLAGENEKLKDDLCKERERNLRTLADFTNYRRRIERDGIKYAAEGKREIILPLLDILDDLEKAMKWADDSDSPVVKGMQSTHKKLLALLKTHGILPFECVGMPFDHNLHEAVSMEKHKAGVPGTVVDELRRGYFWNDVLLRAAQVRVAE